MAVAEYLVANRKDAGMPGPQGPAGPAGVTSARGETLPPGSEVEVSLENRVLTVKVPRGDKGDKGDTGATGAHGPKGDTGAQGPQGERGAKGDTGAQGPQGVQGPKGDRGDGLRIDYTAASSGELPTSGVTEGQTGIVNGELFVWDGSQWSSQGQMQGAKGETGAQGPQGVQGPVGPAGRDGVTPDITIDASVDSTVGTPSVQVVKGGTSAAPSFAFAFSNLKGATGAQGPKGDTGAAGAKGDTGAQGPKGADGEDAVVKTIPVTFEASLFKSGLVVRKSVSGLGSVNMISPAADAGNVAAIQAAGPVLAQDHGDDGSIPEGMVQLTVATAPTADMDFVITVLRSE